MGYRYSEGQMQYLILIDPLRLLDPVATGVELAAGRRGF